MVEDALPAAAPTPECDAGLRCPKCGYNLTGLPQARCPECGRTFEWDQVRRRAEHPPVIAFERARGRAKVSAWFVTWATVLFVPWVFARQVVERVDARHALAFVFVCFSLACGVLVFDAVPDMLAAWLITALSCILVQSVWLSLVDISGWPRPWRSLPFWLLAGCYTSAVMPTEIWRGPPIVIGEELLTFLRGLLHGVPAGTIWISDVFTLSWEAALWWGQMLLWLLGVACCCFVRFRRASRNVWVAVLLAALAVGGVFVLSTLIVQYVGTPIAIRLS